MNCNVSLLDVSKTAMEYADLGNLHRYFRRMRSAQNASPIEERKTYENGLQIANGMQFVVSKGVGLRTKTTIIIG